MINCHPLPWSAQQLLLNVLGVLSALFKTSVEPRLENLALRQQLGVLRPSAPQRSAAKLYDVRSEYALSPLDRRHVLTASYVYELPCFRNSHSRRGYLLGGWELSGIFTWNTRLPQTVTSGTGLDPAGLGTIGGRPDAIGDPNAGPGIQTVDHWFNTAAFADVPVGQYRPGNDLYSSSCPLSRW